MHNNIHVYTKHTRNIIQNSISCSSHVTPLLPAELHAWSLVHMALCTTSYIHKSGSHYISHDMYTHTLSPSLPPSLSLSLPLSPPSLSHSLSLSSLSLPLSLSLSSLSLSYNQATVISPTVAKLLYMYRQ